MTEEKTEQIAKLILKETKHRKWVNWFFWVVMVCFAINILFVPVEYESHMKAAAMSALFLQIWHLIRAGFVKAKITEIIKEVQDK